MPVPPKNTYFGIISKKFFFEINEDQICKDKCCGESCAMLFLVMLKKKGRASKIFAEPVDARCYLVLQPGQYHFELALRPAGT